jgi:hypothetical protein
MLSAVISAASSGANTIVTGVTGKRIRVYGYILSFSGTVNAKWQDSGANNLTGLLYGAATVNIHADAVSPVVGSQPGWFTTTAQGQDLDLNLSGATAVGGHVLYDLVP